jgi:hypothetical protein
MTGGVKAGERRQDRVSPQERPRPDWPNRAHKATALALQRRGLVRVSGKGGSWSAGITGTGRYYLAHKRYPSPDPAPPLRATRRTRFFRKLIEIPDLMRQLQANAGVLVVKGPEPDLRASHDDQEKQPSGRSARGPQGEATCPSNGQNTTPLREECDLSPG